MPVANRWLLPEGIKELLPPHARQTELLRRDILDVFNAWGYDLVMPPLVEHLDSLLTGAGQDLAMNTFKLTDPMSGMTLGVRADITPQVARIDAHRLREEGISRLCYCGSVVHTHSEHILASRNPLQAGAELFGHSGIQSDQEIIQLMLQTLLQIGTVHPITLDLGHVGVFDALIRQAHINDADTHQLLELFQKKALPESMEFIDQLDIDDSIKMQLAALPNFYGDFEMLDQALSKIQNNEARQAIERVKRLGLTISEHYPEVRCYFDLAELRGYHYHTGVVFAAYVTHVGQAIAQGGRYDQIGADFGRARPATGFSLDLSMLSQVLPDATQAEPVILAPFVPEDRVLMVKIAELRKQGLRVMLDLDGALANDDKLSRLVKKNNNWVVEGSR